MDYLQLNESESAALQNAEFFRTKAKLDLKIKELFQELKHGLNAATAPLREQIPSEILAVPGRRHQGENHHGFPWRAFDFPRALSGSDIFLYRCLLLWGHGFSFHLILSGVWKDRYLSSLLSHLPASGLPWLVDLRVSPWEWLPGSELVELEAVSEAKLQQHAAGQPAFKFSLSIPAEKFHLVPAKGRAAWQAIQEACFRPPAPN